MRSIDFQCGVPHITVAELVARGVVRPFESSFADYGYDQDDIGEALFV